MSGIWRSSALALAFLLCACSTGAPGAPGAAPVAAKPTCDDDPWSAGSDEPLPADRVGDWRHVRTFTDGRPADMTVLRDGTVWVVGAGDVALKPYVDEERGCLAVNDTESRGRVWRLDAGTWRLVTPPRTCADSLTGVDAAADGSIWVFGARQTEDGADQPCAARWDGTSWAERTLPMEPDAELAAGSAELWTIDRERPTQLVGGKIFRHEPVAEAGLLARGRDGAVWVAGTRGAGRVQVARRDRGAWRRLPDLILPRLREYTKPWLELDGTVVTAPDDVWVVAHLSWYAEDESEPGRQILARWNGSAWSSRMGEEIVPIGSGEIVSDGDGGVWLADLDHGGLEHVTGGRREPVTLPAPTRDGGTDLRLSQRPGSREVWALDDQNLWSTR
ncbi:hypothetical protein ACFFV7_41200 [Nonomuraea spiralis]|uniref:Uncharacterized protein n=1 Tax=Nonomuraea spiralis TaxID=46182 RepID=A0ABV5IT17_9ACTN|nr:hypothetical protein [Nonomuraea spiralis]GGT17095.1 hypothetical protein GCM10010176_072120 [Nonomuraea spiralis]